MCCINDNEINTYFSKTHSTFSSVDVTLCSSNIVDRFEWNVSDDLYSSDHFPIIISYLQNSPTRHIPHYNIHKADWKLYELYTREIPSYEHSRNHNDTNSFITKFIKDAADKTIPHSIPHTTKYKVPWWSDSLNELVKLKHSIGRRLDTLNRRFNKIDKSQPLEARNLQKMITILIEIDALKPEYNKLSAKFRKEVIQGRIISWRQYVSEISSNTPVKKNMAKI